MLSISIIIPVLNEAETIKKTLINLLQDSEVETIVVDGGSDDRTVEVCQELGAKVLCCTQSKRAYQMNIGASGATGKIFIFLHSDTILPPNYKHWVKTTLSSPKVIAGAFKLGVDSQNFSLRIVETMVNLRSRFLSLPYGDQAFFLYADVFREMEGFKDLSIMEDFEFIQRLRRKGNISIAPVSVLTSDRRWKKLGVLRTTLINQLVIIGYYLGVSPDKLAVFYGRKPKNNREE